MPFPMHLPDHKRRCRARKRDGTRCGQWALTGVTNCKWHSGRQQQRSKTGTGNLPVFYTKHLTRTLKAQVGEMLGLDPDEQVSLYEELALTRHVASQFVLLYGAAVDTGKQETIMIAANGMVEALQNVERICSAANKIKEKQKERFSIHDLNYVIEQLVRIMYEVCGTEHDDLARKFKEMVDEHVSVPVGGVKGTSLRPDETATELDASIPLYEDEDEDDEN